MFAVDVVLSVSAAGHSLGPGALLYIGPDQLLPLTSALAALVGFIIMMWHRIVIYARQAWGFVTGNKYEPPKLQPPPEATDPAASEKSEDEPPAP